MYKCENCGQEFDSNFCPNCGQKRQADKVCPNCGILLKSEMRFCPECGHRFVATVPESKEEPVTENAERFAGNPCMEKADKSAPACKIYRYLKYAPSAVFALFAALLFAFFAGAVAVIPDDGAVENLGSIYDVYSGKAFDLTGFRSSAIAMLVFAVFAIITAAAILFVRLTTPVKYKKVALLGKSVGLSFLTECAAYLFYFVYFIIACVICGKISSLDGGDGMLKAGAGVVCLLVFSLFFALLSAGATVAGYFMCKKFPAALLNEKAEAEKYAAEIAARIAQLEKPCPPLPVEGVQRPTMPGFAEKIIKAKRATGLFAIFFTIFASVSWIGLFLFDYIIESDGLEMSKVRMIESIAFVCASAIVFTVVTLIGACSPAKNGYKCKKLYDSGALIASVIFIVLAFGASCAYPSIAAGDVLSGFEDGGDSFNSGDMIISVVQTFVFLIFFIAMFSYGLVALKRIKTAKKDGALNAALGEYVAKYDEYARYKKQTETYKINSALYENGKDYERTPAFIKWVYGHKAFLVALAVVAVVGIILALVLPVSAKPADDMEDFLSLL